MKISALFRRREIDQRVDEEFEFHLRMQTEENMRQGMNPSEARERPAASWATGRA